jgi:OmpA-OmpF porin, OOP family
MSVATRQHRAHGLLGQAVALLCLLLAVPLLAGAADEGGDAGNALSQGRSLGGMGMAGGAMLGGFKFEPKWSLNADSIDPGSSASLTGENPDYSLNDLSSAGIYALQGIRLSGTGTLPINQGLSLFGKLGVANLSRTGDGAGLFKSGAGPGMDLNYSAGGEYLFSPSLSLHAEWGRFTDYQGDIGQFSAGIHYNFK